jgi:folate-dependent phosphoribosylglycinamide formyltransferase PurN
VSQRVVLLAGEGDSTNIVYHHLSARFDDVVAIVERGVPKLELAKRRAKRLGWPTVAGQVVFVAAVMPLLRRAGRGRISEILAEQGFDTSPIPALGRVESVNSPESVRLLQGLDPKVVVVNGTRIIAKSVLGSVDCPFLNTHAGITPRYRGVHGGYWALRERRRDLVGTTVHLVDPGIDTGGILAQGVFDAGKRDTIVTYPYLHLSCGLPLLARCVSQVLEGRELETVASLDASGATKLRWHPTIWDYLAGYIFKGVK